jgi:hypothetical protein
VAALAAPSREVKTMKTIGLVLVMVGGLLGVGLLALRGRPMGGPPRAPALDSEASAPSTTEIDGLRQKVQTLERLTGALAAQSLSAPPVLTAPAGQPDRVPSREELAENQQRAKGRADAEVSFLEARFRSDVADAAYTQTVGHQLRATLSDPKFKALGLRAVECRATMCRAELDVDSQAAAPLVPALVMQLKALDGGTLRLPDGGKGVAIAFLGRTGHPLPDPPPNDSP